MSNLFRLLLMIVALLSFSTFVTEGKAEEVESGIFLYPQVVERAVRNGVFILVSTSWKKPTFVDKRSVGKYLVCPFDDFMYVSYIIKPESFSAGTGNAPLSFYCGKNGVLKKGHYVQL